MEKIVVIVVKLIIVMVKKVILETKEMPAWERVLIVILFVIPVPFTMEGYMGARTIIRKKVVKC